MNVAERITKAENDTKRLKTIAHLSSNDFVIEVHKGYKGIELRFASKSYRDIDDYHSSLELTELATIPLPEGFIEYLKLLLDPEVTTPGTFPVNPVQLNSLAKILEGTKG